MAKKRRLTEEQKEYNKQLRRIKQFIHRAEKRGYVFSDNIIPKKPKRITKASVRKLQKITPKELYKKARYGGEATYGEIVTGEEGRKAERKASAEKGAKTRKNKKISTSKQVNVSRETLTTDTSFFANAVITNFRYHINQFNEVASTKLTNWLNNLLTKYGEEDVATMLNEGAENGVLVNYQIVYSNDKLTNYISEMLDYLPEMGDFSKAEIMEAFEQDEDYEQPL